MIIGESFDEETGTVRVEYIDEKGKTRRVQVIVVEDGNYLCIGQKTNENEIAGLKGRVGHDESPIIGDHNAWYAAFQRAAAILEERKKK